MSSNATPRGRYISGSCADVWSVTMSIGAPRGEQLTARGPRRCPAARWTADGGPPWPRWRAEAPPRALGTHVAVAVLDAAVDAGRVALDADRDAAVHRDGERLRAAHAAEPRRQGDRPGERAAEPLGRHRGERLVRALEDALRADVDPRTGRHLPVHRQPEGLQAPELLPGPPLRHEVGVGDEHARRPLVRTEDPDRLAGLDHQRLVVLQVAQRADHRVEGVPGPRGPARAAVHDQLVGVFGDLGVEVVHEHAQGGLLLPALGAQCRAARCAYGTWTHADTPSWLRFLAQRTDDGFGGGEEEPSRTRPTAVAISGAR